MKKETVSITLKNGLEARLVAMLVQQASKYDSSIYFETEGKRVNGKSIMGMMSLSLTNGASITVEADGSDETAAVEKICDFLTGKEA